VPLYCGEFGCSQSVPEDGGLYWVSDVARLLDDQRVPWTYWNWKESTGRGSMGVWVKDGEQYVPQQPLESVLSGLWGGTGR